MLFWIARVLNSYPYAINVNNGQVNIASDNAIINAKQNNVINVGGFSDVIERARKETATLVNDEDKKSAEEYIDVIESEIKIPQPKRSMLKTALIGLQAIKGSVEFGAAVAAVVQFIQTSF